MSNFKAETNMFMNSTGGLLLQTKLVPILIPTCCHSDETFISDDGYFTSPGNHALSQCCYRMCLRELDICFGDASTSEEEFV